MQSRINIMYYLKVAFNHSKLIDHEIFKKYAQLYSKLHWFANFFNI